MWDIAPEKCIVKYVIIESLLSGKVSCQFYLRRVYEIVSAAHYKAETVTSLDGVPEEVLNWRNDNYKVRCLIGL